MQSVLHLTNITDVYMLTKFSSDFTQKDLEERWYATLYDGPISKMIYKNLKKLHPDELTRLQELVPFSQLEDSIILSLESTILDNNESAEIFFDKLLIENKINFYQARTAVSLINQWSLFKKLNLLKDQLLMNQSDEKIDMDNINLKKDMFSVNFEQIEASLDYKEIMENFNTSDDGLEEAMSKSYDLILAKIKRSEADLFLWQCLVDKVTCNENFFLDIDTLGVLFSENFTYKIATSQVTIGRSTQMSQVDIDLSTEKRVSRKQCSINMIDMGAFILSNHGKLPVYVDGKIILNSCKTHIYDKSIIEIGKFSMLLLINYSRMQPVVDQLRV
jgi:microspherule protein 1